MADEKGLYAQITDVDSEDIDVDVQGRLDKHQFRRKLIIAEASHWLVHTIQAVILFGMAWRVFVTSRSATQSCAQRHNTWSPAMDTSDHTSVVTFFGTFDGLTPYKGEPNRDTEAAWDNMWNYNTVNLTADQMIELGRPLDSVQYPDEYGGGYLAQVEAIHQLHCLHIIWQAQHVEQVPDLLKIKTRRPGYYERHLQHCIDIIRQRIMCSADPGLITFRWVEGEDHSPEPDFNTPHMCGDWQKLVDWNQENAASIEVDDIRWNAPAGVKKLSEAP